GNVTNITSASTFVNASNETLPFGALFWSNLTFRVGNSSGAGTITLTANSSENHSTAETISFTVLNLSVNSSFSPASVNLTGSQTVNLTIANDAASDPANITSFNMTFNQSDFNLTAASNITAGWACNSTANYLNCSRLLNGTGNLAIFSLTLKAGTAYGNRTGNLTLFDSLGGNRTIYFSQPTILAAGRVSANATTVQNATSRLINLTLSNLGLLTLNSFNGTFPSPNFTSINVTSFGGGLTCANSTTSNTSFTCTGASGYVILNVSANSSSWGPVQALFNVSNSTTSSFEIDPLNFTITKLPEMRVVVDAFPLSVSLSGTTAISAAVINCYGSYYCSNATNVRATWTVSGTGCSVSFTTPHYDFYLESRSPTNSTVSYTVPSQTKATSSTATTCVYAMSVTGYSADSGQNLTYVYVTGDRSVVVANTSGTTTTTTIAPGDFLPGVTTPALSLTLSPTSLAANKGTSRTVTATVRLTGTASLTSALTLTSTSATCCSISVSPVSYPTISNTSTRVFTVTVTIPSTAASGSYLSTLTAASGTYSARANLTIAVLSDAAATTTTTTIPANATNGTSNQTNETSDGNLFANITTNTTAALDSLFKSINRTADYILKLRADGSENTTIAEETLAKAVEYYRKASDALSSGNQTAYEEFLSAAKKAFSEADSIAFGFKVKRAAPWLLWIGGGALAVALLSALVAYISANRRVLVMPKATVAKTKQEMNSVLEQFSSEIKEPLNKKKSGEGGESK
ncbi:MAG: hypothetical protein V1820_04595, partial [archaeon]